MLFLENFCSVHVHVSLIYGSLISPTNALLFAQNLTIPHSACCLLFEALPFIYSPAEQPLNANDKAQELYSRSFHYLTLINQDMLAIYWFWSENHCIILPPDHHVEFEIDLSQSTFQIRTRQPSGLSTFNVLKICVTQRPHWEGSISIPGCWRRACVYLNPFCAHVCMCFAVESIRVQRQTDWWMMGRMCTWECAAHRHTFAYLVHSHVLMCRLKCVS